MTRSIIRAGGIASPTGISGPSTIVVTDGTIESIASGHDSDHGNDNDNGNGNGNGNDHIVDATDDIVGPGLIDVHTHGGAGVQCIDGDVESLQRLTAFYAAHGVTGFLGTIGGSDGSIVRGMRALTSIMANDPSGARCLGVHMEGPFISPCCPGAFRADSIVAPDISLLRRYLALGEGAVALITLAPDIEGTNDLIRVAQANGVFCSAGHSDATEAQTMGAIAAGVTSMTHFFNAMRELHHREPGIIGVGLTEESITLEAIADGVHLHPRMLRLLALAKGCARVALITDSIAAAGLPDGTYHFEEQDIVVSNGQARLADGTLAGSTLTMDAAVRNFAAFAGIEWHEALASATEVPARLIGLDARKGHVAPGFDADLVGFDADRHVRWTMVGGSMVFRR